jgi:origin recognition complex subunit 5
MPRVADPAVRPSHHYPCRERQVFQLQALLSVSLLDPKRSSFFPRFLLTHPKSSLPNPRNVIVHGAEASGKTSVLRAVLGAHCPAYCIVNAKECVTVSHFFDHALSACATALQAEGTLDGQRFPRCDGASAFAVSLEEILRDCKRMILVLDHVDRLREATTTLLPALAQLGESVSEVLYRVILLLILEQIPALTIVFVMTTISARTFRTVGIPCVYFPAYTREETLRILSGDPPPIFLEAAPPELEYTEELAKEDREWLWGRYLPVLWDSLGKDAARDVVSFRRMANKLWRPFVAPIVDGTFGTRDFARLLVSRRALFQSETCLVNSIVTKSSDEEVARPAQGMPYPITPFESIILTQLPPSCA